MEIPSPSSIVESIEGSSDSQRFKHNRGLRCKTQKSNQIFQIIKIKNKKKWTKEEDILLIKLADKYREKHWKEISKNFVNKNALQCFSRYKRIRPGIIKGSWNRDEDEKILKLVQIYGKAWSKISKVLVSRNGKQIRDRFINVLDPEIKKGKFTEEEDSTLIRLYMYYGPKWATISKHFLNRTADMIKNRFHSSIKKFFFGNHQSMAKKSSYFEKKYNLALDANHTFSETANSHNNITPKISSYNLKNLAIENTTVSTNRTNSFSLTFPDTNSVLNNEEGRYYSNNSNNCVSNIRNPNTYYNCTTNSMNKQICTFNSENVIKSMSNNQEINPYVKIEEKEYRYLHSHEEHMHNHMYNNQDVEMNLKEDDDFNYDGGSGNLFNFEDYFTV